jgi:hypothetical protein
MEYNVISSGQTEDKSRDIFSHNSIRLKYLSFLNSCARPDVLTAKHTKIITF